MSRLQREEDQLFTNSIHQRGEIMNDGKLQSELRQALKIALVFDLPEKLNRSPHTPFPPFAEAEWETRETILRIGEAWRKIGYDVIELPIDKNFLTRWASDHQTFDLVHTLVEGWGTPSREAWIPALCELSGIPYIGSNPSSQCLAMRKSTFKILCHHLDIPTPRFYVLHHETDLESVPFEFLNKPHFIKPDCEGSGMGIDISHSISESIELTRQTCKTLLKDFPDGILLEELVDGIELTSAFLGTEPFESLPVAQIEVDGGVYGLAHKGKDEMGERVTFPKLPERILATINHSMQLLQVHAGLEDFTRFDWKLNSSGEPMLLEANPLAGLSYYYSVLPKMAAEAGYTYEKFLGRLASSALYRKDARRFWYGRSRIWK